ncbi:GNAT family N-acetyltransferase [Armatimonas rosea]|uniref:Ribosomal protein S18 acetylase RimI-like enzyme n=1 Tax=Armatimonas rosea TaxID=685828 RepID=A0A7W9W999_ARMRO|nr:GNAT family N-acetyltransferase [Armatimonas rosea]MBB6053056.1 ribosomal protein S18 acetylase RimI-like enzyme [Armatimonas rosea]
MSLLALIDDYLDAAPAQACDVERIGPFRLFFRRDSEMPEISYARPVRGERAGTLEEIAAVRAAFLARGRRPRWEYLEELNPELGALLVQAGIPAPTRRPLQVVTAERFHPESSTLAQVRYITPDEAPATDAVLATAFGGDPAEADGSFLRGLIERGACAVAAFVGGKPVAAGLHSPVGSATEVAGVGTHPEWRRKGLAGAVTSALVADALARGCGCIFLSAGDESVARVYGRLGFERVGTALDTMLPPEL